MMEQDTPETPSPPKFEPTIPEGQGQLSGETHEATKKFKPEISPTGQFTGSGAEADPTAPKFQPLITESKLQLSGETHELIPRYQAQIPPPAPFTGSGAEADPRRPRLSQQVSESPPFKGSEVTGVQGKVDLKAWKGMVSNANPHLLAGDNTSMQVNMMSVVIGQVQCRSGMRAVIFEN